MEPSINQKLESLKLMSKALKKQSQKQDDSTTSLIKSILKMTQAPKSNRNPSNSDKSQQFPSPTKSQGKLYHIKQQQSTRQHEKIKSTQQHQAKDITQQNCELKVKLALLEQQLNQKQNKIKKYKNQLLKIHQTPYFRTENNLKIFCTNLTIPKDSLGLMDFQKKHILLELDKLTIMQNSYNREIFNLLNLKQVSYYDKHIIQLHFEAQSEQISNIYLQFTDQQQERKWDLSLYVNWTIAMSKIKPLKLFKNEQFQISNNLQKIFLYGNNNQTYKVVKRPKLSIKTLLPIKIQSTQAKVQPSQNINMEEYPSSFQLLSPSKRVKLSPQKIIQRKKFKEALQRLKKGYEINKYSKKGWFVHLKKIYVDQEKRLLCLQDVKNKSDIKKHPINMIQNIEYMQFGEGVKAHIQKPKPNNFVMIQLKNKTLQLGLNNPQLIYEFSNCLNDVWSYYYSRPDLL